MNKRAWYIGLTLNVLLLVSLLAGGAWYFTRPVTAETEVVTTTQPKTPVTVRNIDYFHRPDLDKEKLYPLINQERINAGLEPLTVNPLLEQSACLKAQNMVTRNYWSHNTPDGVEPWHFFDQVSYPYLNAGENLLYGAYTERTAVTGWMNSPSHKENIVGNYVETGICVLNGAKYQELKSTNVVVQHFGTQ